MVHEQGFLNEIIYTSTQITGVNKNSGIFFIKNENVLMYSEITAGIKPERICYPLEDKVQYMVTQRLPFQPCS